MSNSVIADIISESVREEPCELLCLHNGLVIALSPRALGCYRSCEAVQDPLGNGLLAFCQLAEQHSIQFQEQRCVTTYSGGYVGLCDGKALLIAPGKVRLFANNEDGLRGINVLAEMDLPDIDVR
ncbi:MAG: hypothetical protein CML06_03080 [Pseudomonadales bacterium]|nr:hypothetical protein [Pseudomonadales bacterium]